MTADRGPGRVRMTSRHWERIAIVCALAGLPAAGEAAAMRATSFTSALALAPQVAAPGAIGASYRLIQRSAATWQASALAIAVNPAWPPSPWGDASFAGQDCGP